MAKPGVQPITTASLPTPKLNIPKPKAGAKVQKPNTKAMSALFGKKVMKPTVQSVPTKVSSF